MGQYYLIANLDKQQYIDPHDFGDGAKLIEFGCSSTGTMTALAILLADGKSRDSLVLRTDDPIVGCWAGDRIVVTGDYADTGRFVTGEQNLYCHVRKEHWQNVSAEVIRAMATDPWIARALEAAARALKPDVRPNAADHPKLPPDLDTIWQAERARTAHKVLALDAVERLRAEGGIVAVGVRRASTGELYVIWQNSASDDVDSDDNDELLLKKGDCFALDGCAYPDGDVMYVEILEVVARFPDYVDHTGAASGGYRVAVHCDEKPTCVEDYYGWDFVDRKCVPLSLDDMMRARSAGWPRTYVRFREVLGDEIALLDFRGVPVPLRGSVS